MLDGYRFLSEINEVLSDVRRRLGEPAAIEGRPLESAWFIDGSFSASERQGSFVALLSAASVGVVSRKLVEGLSGAKHPLLHILVPKSYGETRSTVMMGALELMEGLRSVSTGVEAVVFDGSYLASLLTGYGPVYSTASQAREALERQGLSLNEAVARVSREIDEQVDALVERMASESRVAEVYKIAREALTRTYDFAEKIYEALSEREEPAGVLSRQLLIDYSVLFSEVNLYLRLLGALLQAAREREVLPVWVAKESSSRFLSDTLAVKSWLNDTVLLESVWQGKARVYIALEDYGGGKAFQPVSPPREPVASAGTIHLLYRWSRFQVVYFKTSLHGPVLQATFPSDLVPRDRVEDILATLTSLSDEKSGYPRPLALVHHKALLQSKLADVVATELWRGSRGVLRSILSPLGREVVL